MFSPHTTAILQLPPFRPPTLPITLLFTTHSPSQTHSLPHATTTDPLFSLLELSQLFDTYIIYFSFQFYANVLQRQSIER